MDVQRPRKIKKKKKKGMKRVAVDTEFDLMNYRPEISVMADINEFAKIGQDQKKDAWKINWKYWIDSRNFPTIIYR